MNDDATRDPIDAAVDAKIAAAVADAIAGRRVYIADPDTSSGRQEILRRMRIAAGVFWSLAIYTGCHAFIEICGLMRSFIDVCERRERESAGWIYTDIHSRTPVEFEAAEWAYFLEKLECLLGRKVRIEFL